jgi:peptide/nickel transport system substrate-binding protein
MKLDRLICASPSGRIFLAALAILFPLCVGSAFAAAEPGTITIVLEQEPTSLDLTDTVRNSTGQLVLKNVADTLVDIDPTEGKIMPRLATAWKQLDATTWQLFLRKGVKFHDGGDFNAEAVVFNFKRLYDKRIATQTRNKFFSSVKIEAKALDSHTVEVKTDKPEPLFLTLLGMPGICSPNTPLDKLVRNPIGTGPYRFVKWDAGSQIIFERFDGYWGKLPQVKKAIYVWRSDSAVRAAMVLIGEADFTPTISAQDAKRPDLDYSYLNMDTTALRIGGEWEPPLSDRRVRMAMNYAVDRNAIRGTILSKEVVPATQMVLPDAPGYNPDVKLWPYDPEKARQLLAEARKDGVPVDKEILMIGRIGHFPGTDELNEALFTMYKAVGLNVKLKMVEIGIWNTYRYKPFPANAGAYLLMQQLNSSLDAALMAFQLFHCKGNVSVTCDKALDALIEKALAATGEERKKFCQAAFKRVQEEIIPDAMLFHMVQYSRVGKRISFKPSPATIAEIPLEQITFK